MTNAFHWRYSVAAAALTMLPFMFAGPVFAGPGHDHGEEAAAQATQTPAMPRFETSSDRFEIVGRVEGQDLRLWVDDWATNAPINSAQIEIGIGARKALAKPAENGTYTLSLPEHDVVGTYPISIAIKNAGAPALLGGNLVISEEHAHGSETGLPFGLSLASLIGGGAALLIALGGAFWLLRRRRGGLAVATITGTIFAAGLGLWTGTPAPAIAGGDHDHGKEVANAASPDQATRMGDGTIVAPKSMQRLIGLQTIVAIATDTSATLTLPGTIIADPNGSGVVQAQVGGRVSGTLPALGQVVGRGQVLAVVTPGVDPGAVAARQEAQGQVAQEAAVARARAAGGATEIDGELAAARVRASTAGTGEAQAALNAARAKIARLERLEGIVPRRELDAARAEANAATARINAQRAEALAEVRALEARRGAILSATRAEAQAAGVRANAIRPLTVRAESLRAPVSGVVSTVNVAQGQVVGPGETLFTIVDPDRLLVEARATDTRGFGVGTAATGRTSDGRTLTLTATGTGLALINGAAPVRFSIENPLNLRAGEPVNIFAGGGEPISGVAIPREAVSRGANGQMLVFVKESAERFVGVPVTIAQLDASRVLVTGGLNPGARVATIGAPLLAQVR